LLTWTSAAPSQPRAECLGQRLHQIPLKLLCFLLFRFFPPFKSWLGYAAMTSSSSSPYKYLSTSFTVLHPHYPPQRRPDAGSTYS
jgi:hypothetical protein